MRLECSFFIYGRMQPSSGNGLFWVVLKSQAQGGQETIGGAISPQCNLESKVFLKRASEVGASKPRASEVGASKPNQQSQ